jgi:hypothetical protein
MTSANEYSRRRGGTQHNQRTAKKDSQVAGAPLPNASVLARLREYKTTHDLNWDVAARLCGVGLSTLHRAYGSGTISDRLAARITLKLDTLEGRLPGVRAGRGEMGADRA